jgi:NADP-dependent 3-hydroxy acid dehydrogenase YdfG
VGSIVEILQFGRIDCIIVTAAVYRDYSCANVNDNIKHVFDVNVWGYLNVVTELLKFQKNIENSIPVIAISSTLAQKAVQGSLPYSLSKRALENIVQLMKYEVPENKINCLIYVAPPFNSEMNPTSLKSALCIANNVYETFKLDTSNNIYERR